MTITNQPSVAIKFDPLAEPVLVTEAQANWFITQGSGIYTSIRVHSTHRAAANQASKWEWRSGPHDLFQFFGRPLKPSRPHHSIVHIIRQQRNAKGGAVK